MYKAIEGQTDEDFEKINENKLKEEFEKYRLICAINAPYPLKYFAHDKQYLGEAVLIGFLLEKGLKL